MLNSKYAQYEKNSQCWNQKPFACLITKHKKLLSHLFRAKHNRKKKKISYFHGVFKIFLFLMWSNIFLIQYFRVLVYYPADQFLLKTLSPNMEFNANRLETKGGGGSMCARMEGRRNSKWKFGLSGKKKKRKYNNDS